jgi:hypothetical protein
MGLSHESEWTKSAEHLGASPCMTDLSIDTTFSLIDTTFSLIDTTFSLIDTTFSLIDTTFSLIDTTFSRTNLIEQSID